MDSYEEKKRRLINEIRCGDHLPIGLNKETSNLFRDREELNKHWLNVKDFNKVLEIDAGGRWAITEGMTTYRDLVDATLTYGVLPAVVPQLKSITVGGAVAGVGIEASSFKYGLVHETILEMDILLSDGRVVTCTPDSDHKDLFFGFPNSYGTLGYALKLKVKCMPAKAYVRIDHIPYSDANVYFRDLDDCCRKDADFIDGTLFAPDELYLNIATFTDEAPFVSDYTDKDIYYRSIREKRTDYLTTRDFIWRWDTDWFWCSKNLYVQNPLIRRLVGKSRLNSVTYTKVMRWNSRWGLTRGMTRLLGVHTESVIQDVDIPIRNAGAFVDLFHREIDIRPIWICPIHVYDAQRQYTLYPLSAETVYINFGFWDVIKSRKKLPSGHYNRKIERMVANLGGIKSLYSDSFYTPDAFWQIYDKPVYERLKAKYDPQHALKDLYQKCVLQQ